MSADLHKELQEAEDRAAQIRRQIAAASCAEVGHDWKHIGGCNAGCDDDCSCSVPVHRCTKCGDCDYGDNAEAAEKIAKCSNGEDAEHL